jgi:hypothetical protein
MTKKETKQTITVRLLQDPGKAANLNAYVVDASGKIVEGVSFDGKEAKLTSSTDVLSGKSKVYIAAALPENIQPSKMTERTLIKGGAYNLVKNFNGNFIDVSRIPSGILRPFPYYNCLIRGNVNKNFNIDGQFQNLPLCDLRVHICEVETELIWPYIPIYYRRIPDWVIQEIAGKIREFTAIEKPIIRKPIGPDPAPDASHLAQQTKFNLPMRDLKMKESFALSNQVKQIAPLPNHVSEAFMATDVRSIRQAMINYHEIIYPYLCLWPIYWPWIYTCDEETVVATDCNGNFEMWENTFSEDGPLNIYIWVEAFIGGSWQTVYRPPIPCNTWWNYACNTNINITLTDPRVLPCNCGQNLHGEIVWFKSIGEYATALHVEQSDSNTVNVQGVNFPNVGCTDVTDAHRISPFGSSLSFKLLFGDGLPAAGITHYRWRKTRIKNEVLTDILSPSTFVVDGSIQKSYYVITTDGSGHMHFETKSVTLGAEGSGQNIGYRIPHWDIYQDPGVPAADKLLTIQWTSPDFWSASLDSHSLSDGLWRFDLELLQLNGANVFQIVQVPKQVFQVSDYSNSGNSIDAPDNYLMIGNQYLNTIPPNSNADNLAVKARIDNAPCDILPDGNIYNAELVETGEQSGQCGFIHYNNTGQHVRLRFKASHPRNFATFSFDVVKGDGSLDTGIHPAGYVISGIGGFTLSGGDFSKDFTVSDLLGTCPGQAAFSENLHVAALATDGTNRLYAFDYHDIITNTDRNYDVHDTNAFAISNA